MLLRGALAAKFATLEKIDIQYSILEKGGGLLFQQRPPVISRLLRRSDGHDARPPKIIYRAETTEIAATLASTGVSPSGKAVSMRITCPACGDCMPSFLASVSMRSGSRSEASSRRRARFISANPSRWVFSDSILYPYSMAVKCCQA